MTARKAEALRFVTAFRGDDKKALADVSPVGWPVTREKLADQLIQRLKRTGESGFPDQAQTSRCGPAAFLYCLLHDRPDLYVRFIFELWQNGVSNLNFEGSGPAYLVAPSAGTMRATAKALAARMLELDWISMASLSKGGDRTADPSDSLSAITYPSHLREWFEAVGSKPAIFQFSSVLGDSWISSIGLADLQKAIALWKVGWIVLEINPEVIEGQPKSSLARHWVVVNENSMPTFDGKTLDTFVNANRTNAKLEKITMQLACWGRRDNLIKKDITVASFLDEWFGVAAFSRIQ